MMIRWWEHSQKGVTDRQTDRRTDWTKKTLDCHLNFWKCTLTVEYIAVLRVATLIFAENKMAGGTTIYAKYMASGCLFMHRWLWFGNSTTRFCNATPNFDKCHYIRCLCAEFAAKHTGPITAHKALENLAWILAHDSRPIYRAPTYIAVPLLGPHQPRYIWSTLYSGNGLVQNRHQANTLNQCCIRQQHVYELIWLVWLDVLYNVIFFCQSLPKAMAAIIRQLSSYMKLAMMLTSLVSVTSQWPTSWVSTWS